MDTLFIAKVIGLYALIEGTSMLVARPALLKAFHDAEHNRTISYLLGIVVVIIGLFVVVLHTVFADMLTTVVTLAGWLTLILGINLVFLSEKSVQVFFRLVQRPGWYHLIAGGYLVLGIYLTIRAFA